jgi:adenylate kinase family enzyme
MADPGGHGPTDGGRRHDLRAARRILVLGPPGAGKSTFSVRLAAVLQLPVVHLDRYFWKPGWTPSSMDDFASESRALAQQSSWVMDGNYGGTLAVRAPYADHVVYVGASGVRCTWSFLVRATRWRGRQRPDMAEGCPDVIEWRMLWSVFRHQSGHRARTLKRLTAVALDTPVTILRSRTAANRLISALAKQVGQ